MLLLNSNGKVCMGSALVRLHLNFVNLSHCQGHSDFEDLYLVKELSKAMCYY